MTDKKTPRKPIDWEAVERDYRAGALTYRDLGAKYGCSHVAVQKRARTRGWARSELERDPKKVPLERPVDRSGFIYVIYLDAPDRFYKIGMTQNLGDRFGAHQCSSPFELCIACAYFSDDMVAEERRLHAMFEDKRVRGEWFRLNSDDLATIAARSLIGGV